MRVMLLRPGALGDVVVARAAIAAIRDACPDARIVLGASGARGRLLWECGIVEEWFDFERADVAWLFGEGGEPPPAALADVFSDIDVLFAYMRDSDRRVQDRVHQLGCACAVFAPPRPDETGCMHVHDFLAAPVQSYFHVLDTCAEAERSMPRLRVPREQMLGELNRWGLKRGGYCVLHPGSGGVRKNWPMERFIELGQRLAQSLSVVVTAGEADGVLGRLVAEAVSGAVCIESPTLIGLAGILAGAKLYVGNDSGVSHLAAAVCGKWNDETVSPACVTLFGPTSPTVWAPFGSRILVAPDGNLETLPVERVSECCAEILSP